MDWPTFDEGNLPAAKRLAKHSKDKNVMLFVSAVIGAFADKSQMLFNVYTAAGELKSPVPATPEQKAFHTDPIRSRSFYYFNEDAAPLNELPGYKEDESDSKVDCAKTVSVFYLTRSPCGRPAVFTSLRYTFFPTQRQGPVTEQGSSGYMFGHCASCNRFKGGHALVSEGACRL